MPWGKLLNLSGPQSPRLKSRDNNPIHRETWGRARMLSHPEKGGVLPWEGLCPYLWVTHCLGRDGVSNETQQPQRDCGHLGGGAAGSVLEAACAAGSTPRSQSILRPKLCCVSWACSPVALTGPLSRGDSGAPFNPKKAQDFWRSGWGVWGQLSSEQRRGPGSGGG